MTSLNLTNALKGFITFYNSINSAVIETIGIDVQYMRVVPHENSEDVIFHEYTLHDVACPVSLKVVTSNTSYNPGNFTIDYFGINYEAPFEVSIDKNSWHTTMGNDVMPQQHDIVYVEIYNALYEVATSTLEYGIASQETAYKMQLVKWNPRANVRLSENLEDTIEDLTVGVQELFGEEMSKQIADIVDDEETNGYLNSEEKGMDVYKTVDMDSIISEDVYTNENTVARSYYDIRDMNQNIVYNTGDAYIPTEEESYRYFSCWFKTIDSETKEYEIGKLEQDKGNYYFETEKDLSNKFINGDDVVIKRGSLFMLHAIFNKVATFNGVQRYMLTLDEPEFKRETKKITNWNNNLVMEKDENSYLLLGKKDDACNFTIGFTSNSVFLIKFGKKSKRISLDELPKDSWIGIGLNLGAESTLYVYTVDAEDNYKMKLHSCVSIGDMTNTFEVDEFYIVNSNIYLTNIRMYKVTEPSTQSQIEKDLNSQLVRNDSKTIINDNAALANQSPYMGQPR